MYLSHGSGEHTPTTPAFESLVVCKSTKENTMLQLLFEKAGLRVNNIAVRLARLAHPLKRFLRIGLFPVLGELEISSSKVSRAACEAADPRECQGCFRAHKCDDIPVQMLRHLVVELPPVFELRRSP